MSVRYTLFRLAALRYSYIRYHAGPIGSIASDSMFQPDAYS